MLSQSFSNVGMISNGIFSTPWSKQRNLALHCTQACSEAIQDPHCVHGGPAYLELLLDGPFDSSATGVAEAAAKEALADLNKLANEPYTAYVKRKLGG